MTDPAAQPRESYSPHRRTALVFTGTGTAGAYHAGVLRAFHEAGIKIDLVAGRGVGAATAMFAAVDGASRLWEPGGPWRARRLPQLYAWRQPLRAAAWALAVSLALLLLPLVALAAGVIVYPAAFLLRVVGADAGSALAAGYVRLIAAAFEPAGLPTILPRLVAITLVGVLAALFASAHLARLRRRLVPRERARFWWLTLGAPFTIAPALRLFAGELWRLVGGLRARKPAAASDLSRRYTELLRDNLGQPGFRELLLVTHDLDTRRDVVFALLAEPRRREFFLRRPGAGGERRAAEAFDLGGTAADLMVDVLCAALTVPLVTEPHLVRFAAESYWRGETHRLTDRPDALARLLEEVWAAGAEQVIVVSAAAEILEPYGLRTRRGDLHARAGEIMASLEAAALRDAVLGGRSAFAGLFEIHPAYNPVAPFDFRGCFDERSDRRHALGELVDRGYEDAYRQFIDPVVAADGERLGQSSVLGPAL